MKTPDLQLIHGDSLEVMRGMADNSIDLILTDPPYHKVKSEAWDNQHKTADDFLVWIDSLLGEYQRILKPNGSLYFFVGPKMSARIEIIMAKHFVVLNNISWKKHDGTENKGGAWSCANKAVLRRFFEQKEVVLFAEHYGADSFAKGESGYQLQCDRLRGFIFEPIRSYLKTEWQRAGLTPNDANKACGTRSMAGRHFFSISQWCLPTEKHYTALRDYANKHGQGDCFLRREHGILRREYESLRREYESLRRPFYVNKDVHFTDVWEFQTVRPYPGKHPCEKPLAMMEHIILSSSREGDTIFDGFMGSGSTGVAALKLNRRFIGVELDQTYFDSAQARCAQQPS
jgi:site-specific DNA-methyltransferase (adenine-specific)